MVAVEFDSVILLGLLQDRNYTVDELCKGFDWSIEELAIVIVYLNLKGTEIKVFYHNKMEGEVTIGLET